MYIENKSSKSGKASKDSKLSKSSKSSKLSKASKAKIQNDDLLMLLNEAENITLQDLEFDNILKEQGKIICNINNILSGTTKDKNTVCNIGNSLKDTKFKKILSRITKKKDSTNVKENSLKHTLKKHKKHKSRKHTLKNKKQHSKPIKPNSKSKPSKIRKISLKNQYLYKHYNKRKYDITITKPNIFIKAKK